jgi:hypothetical protein
MRPFRSVPAQDSHLRTEGRKVELLRRNVYHFGHNALKTLAPKTTPQREPALVLSSSRVAPGKTKGRRDLKTGPGFGLGNTCAIGSILGCSGNLATPVWSAALGAVAENSANLCRTRDIRTVASHVRAVRGRHPDTRKPRQSRLPASGGGRESNPPTGDRPAHRF